MPDREYSLREARPEDVPLVLRLVRSLAEYERLLDQLSATEQDFGRALFGACPRAYAVLAWAGEEAVGLALWYYAFSTFTGGPDLFLEDIFVEPAWRKRGIGLAMFRYLARRARAENCRRLEWRVLNWNAPAIDFYRRIGAQPMQDWSVQRLEGEALAALGD
ncbi:MAG: GNAT family N-acetyltransferase [Pseudomonadota bacterium]|nr:GNAT family N-acetyltransferase [Pseudomonadota bacterium]